MKIFLEAKAWQLFVLLFGLPLLAQIFAASAAFSRINHADFDQTSRSMLLSLGFSFGVGIIAAATQFGWMWSIGKYLHNLLPDGVQMNGRLFRLALAVPLVVGLLGLAFGGWILWHIFNNTDTGLELQLEPLPILLPFFAVFMLLGLLSFVALLFAYHFCGKSLKSIEIGREALLGEWLGEACLVWLSFVGVWFLQPRIQKVLAAKASSEII